MGDDCRNGGGWILVVEDDEDVRLALVDALGFAGYPVRSAEHGEAALDCILDHGLPAAALVDLLMPRMGGAEFLRVLRRSDEGRAVPVVLLTGRTETDDLPPCFERLLKPFDLDVLLEVVERAVAAGAGCPRLS